MPLVLKTAWACSLCLAWKATQAAPGGGAAWARHSLVRLAAGLPAEPACSSPAQRLGVSCQAHVSPVACRKLPPGAPGRIAAAACIALAATCCMHPADKHKTVTCSQRTHLTSEQPGLAVEQGRCTGRPPVHARGRRHICGASCRYPGQTAASLAGWRCVLHD